MLLKPHACPEIDKDIIKLTSCRKRAPPVSSKFINCDKGSASWFAPLV